MITTEEIQGLLFRGSDVVGEDGKKIGSVGQVFLDATSGDPAWVTVRTGLFGTGESFVPLAGAVTDGDDLRVAHTKDVVRHAPRIDTADGMLSPAEEHALYLHYGLATDGAPATGEHALTGHDDAYDGSGAEAASFGTAGLGAGEAPVAPVSTPGPPPATARVATPSEDDDDRWSGGETGAAITNPGPVGEHHGARPTPEVATDAASLEGPDDDDSMVISHERLRVVGTERVPTERVRLVRYTVTENRTMTVPVSKERYHVEYEPAEGWPDDDTRGDDVPGATGATHDERHTPTPGPSTEETR